MPATNVRVIVRLPFNRPENPFPDPPRVEWSPDKEKILWEVIARSRATDNGGTDWKGLAAHLEVPLPYLLYRAQTRYEEDLRGLQDIKGAPSPITTDVQPDVISSKATPIRRVSGLAIGGLPNSSIRITTPLGIRARLNSFGINSPVNPRPIKVSSSSVVTLQGFKRPVRVISHSSSEESSESEEIEKLEEADRQSEEQEILDRKLKDLEKMITGDRLGLVRSSRYKDKQVDRAGINVVDDPQYHSLDSSSRSQSASSAGSPHGSIPSIPSPLPESLPHSPMRRHISPGKSPSPPALSPRSAHGQPHIRYGGLVTIAAQGSDTTSNHGSSASSFSDISDASLSASALESALLSNGRSRFSTFARSNFGRGSRAVQQ